MSGPSYPLNSGQAAQPPQLAPLQQAPSFEQFQELRQMYADLAAKMEVMAKLAPEAAQTLAEAKEPVEVPAKVYHTTNPHSGVQIMRGPGICETVYFAGTELVTTDPAVQAFLDQIVDKPGCPIYSKDPSVDVAVLQAAQENQKAAATVLDKLLLAGQRPT